MVFAYFAPEVALPLASAVAAAFGFILMVGRAPFRFAARGLRAVMRRVRGETLPGAMAGPSRHQPR
jgi:hypothetical protein